MRPIHVILLLFTMLSLLTLHHQHSLYWDESVYVGMGKYMFSGGQVGIWEEIRPLGLPLLLGMIWVVGLPVVLSGQLLAILFAIGMLYMTYLITKEFFDEKTGLIAAAILAMTPVFFFWTGFMLTGIPSTFFGLAAVYFMIYKNYKAAGVAAGLSFLFRYTQGLILLGILLILLKKKEATVKTAAAFAITVLPLLVLNYVLYGNMLSPFLAAASHQGNMANSVMDGTFLSYLYNYLYYPIELTIQNPLLLLSLFGLWSLRKKIHAIISVLAVQIIYFSLIVNKQVRFSLVFLPYIAMLAAYSIKQYWRGHIRYAISALVIVSIMLVYTSYPDVAYRLQEDPAYEFYSSIEGGPYLSTTPKPVAYTDVLLIPMYNNVEDAASIYEAHKQDVEGVIYNPDFYPCTSDPCSELKERLQKNITEDFSNTLHDERFTVYS